jgi:RNA polymerase sigma-70 factor (ECF subfamily)
VNEQDFATTLARARAGDPQAMTRLVEAYEPQIRRVAHRRLGPLLRAALDSMDLVQSVHRSLLLCLRRNKFTFAGPQDLVALAVTMVKRKAARQSTRLRREQEILQLRERLLPRARPERAAALETELQDILETLKEADRQLLRLYLEGYSTVDAARILGVEPDSLRVRRSRLFHKLRDAGLDLG